MRDYQPTKNNPYWLPYTLYRRTLSLIRDYDRMAREHEDIPTDKSAGSGGSGIGDPTGSAGTRSAEISRDLAAVDHALKLVPEEYRAGVWKSAAYSLPYPKDADRSTYSRQKRRFIFNVAVNKGWIGPAGPQ